MVVVAHARRNLAEGVGGPQDPTILLDPEDLVASATGLPVTVELAEIRARDVAERLAPPSTPSCCSQAVTRHHLVGTTAGQTVSSSCSAREAEVPASQVR